MKDILEQLAEVEVREPPPDFDRRLHQRVNRMLVVQQIIDFFVGAIAWGAVHFFRAALAGSCSQSPADSRTVIAVSG